MRGYACDGPVSGTLHRSELTHLLGWCTAQSCIIPITDIVARPLAVFSARNTTSATEGIAWAFARQRIAVGYTQRFFLGIEFEEALILAVFG